MSSANLQNDTLRLLQWGLLCQQIAQLAQTEAGRRVCLQIQPAMTLYQAQQWLTETREALNLELTLATGLPFGGIRDVQAAVERSQIESILEGRELLDIASTLGAARKIKRTIEDQEVAETPDLLDLVQTVRGCPELEQTISYCLDDSGLVNDRASATLAEARTQQRRIRDKVQRTLQTLLQRHPVYFQEALITERDQRFVLLVKVNYKEQVPGIVHDTSSSGQTLYIEPMSVIQEQNNLRQWQRAETAEVERILRELSQGVAEKADDILHLLSVLTLLDRATACARYGQLLDAIEPEFTSGELSFYQLRHPLLVTQAQHDPSREVVPIHLELSEPVRCVVITGPNTGGKTLTLKATGLAVLMAKAGLFIPASRALIPWCDQVLADIGDEQSLEQSLSTFSSHIRRIVQILHTVTPNDLVLLDEVGAGTDPQEGSALAAALLTHLATVSRYTLATTHYGELKALKYRDERFENASVEFDEVSLAPTYRLLWGIPGRSNALNIARRLGLPETILTQAAQWLSPETHQVNQVIAELEAQLREQDTQTQQASDLRVQVEKLQQELVTQKEALIRERISLQQQQQHYLHVALSEARAQVAQIIRQLQANPTAQQASQANQALTALEPEVQPIAQTYQPQVGDRVEILALDQKGEVLALQGEQAVVRSGILKLTVPISQLWPVGKAKPPKGSTLRLPPAPQPTPRPPAIRTTQNTLDIRGERATEIEILLLDKLSASFGYVWIVHGRGTGRLREAVHSFLKTYDRVESFALAETGDGGAGATVVYLR